MHTTTTYAKRHRLKSRQENIPDDGTSEESVDRTGSKPNEQSSNRKRKRPTQLKEVDTEPLKKKKLSETVNKQASSMSVHPFQTPFPTLQAQTQTFRLPSSSPQHLPGLLSPVPVVLHTKLSTTRELKENHVHNSAGNNKSWYPSKYGDFSKTLSSVTLKSNHFSPDEVSGPGLQIRSHRHDRSRSTSRSSSNSSAISSTLKDTQKSHSGLKHSQSLTSLKADGKPKRKQKQKLSKPRRQTSAKLIGDNFLPLASPFVSRSSSPVKSYVDENQNAHTPTDNDPNLANQGTRMGPPPVLIHGMGVESKSRRSNMRSGLSDTFFNANLPGSTMRSSFPSRGFGNGLGHVSQSTKSSTLKGTRTQSQMCPENVSSRSKTYPKTNFEIEELVPALEEIHKARKHLNIHDQQRHPIDRERRPSAPSSLQIPRAQRHFNLCSVPARHADRENPATSVPEQNRKIRLNSGLSIVLAPSSQHPGPRPVDYLDNVDNKHPKKKNSRKRDADSTMEWMHVRGAIDFNRPPSQMSFGGGFGFEYPEVEGVDVFFSSSSDEDEDERCDVSHGDHGSDHYRTRGRAPIAARKEVYRSKSAFDFDDPPAMLNFGEDIWGTSTPFKNAVLHLGAEVGRTARESNAMRLDLVTDGHETDLVVINAKKQRRDQEEERTIFSTLTRSVSLPNFKTSTDSPNIVLLSSLGLGPADDIGIRARIVAVCGEKGDEEDGDEEIDMELTGSRITGGTHVVSSDKRRDEGRAECEGDWTPWVTDSIVSPPTGYLQWAINKGDARVGDKNSSGDRDGEIRRRHEYEDREETLSTGSSDLQHQWLSSPFKLSDDVRSPKVVDSDVVDQRDLQTREQSALKPDTGGNTAATAALSEPEAEEATARVEDARLPLNTKRTRSGTIVPIGVHIPSGTRRTRSGTIVGPLPVAAPTIPLPSVPIGLSEYGNNPTSGTDPGFRRRSRSGTITGPILAEIPTGGRIDGDNTGQLSRIETSANGVDTLEADEAEGIECYMDSMYLPALTSSPDPIDFLRFASIMEEEEENYGPTGFASGRRCGTGSREITWQVAEDPPSPEIAKKRGNKILRGMGLGGKGWSLTGRAGRKQKSRKKARFTSDVPGDNEGKDEDEEIGRNGDAELSDDELLLLPGTMGHVGSL